MTDRGTTWFAAPGAGAAGAAGAGSSGGSSPPARIRVAL